MTFDEVAPLNFQPALGPPGPRVIAVLALTVIAAVAWTSRALAHGLTLVTRPRPQAIPVEVPRRRVRSRHEA
jgi:hypothetical protein